MSNRIRLVVGLSAIGAVTGAIMLAGGTGSAPSVAQQPGSDSITAVHPQLEPSAAAEHGDATGTYPSVPDDTPLDSAAADTAPRYTAPADTAEPATADIPFPLFSEAAHLWASIPDDPVIDERSAAMTSRLVGVDSPVASLLVEYGIPIYLADDSSPRATVRCTADWEGPCGPESYSPVPMPTAAAPNEGSDGAMVVVDVQEGRTYEYWRAEPNDDGTWTAEWGSSNDTGGDGITISGGSASRFSRLAGLVLTQELEAWYIGHAIAIASSESCEGVWRPPAESTDGTARGEDCIPQGARIQLDPSIDLDALELRPIERIIGRALQTHGAYVVDRSSSPISIFFQRETTPSDRPSLGPVATELGVRWDYDGLGGLPWNRLRVLASWDGT